MSVMKIFLVFLSLSNCSSSFSLDQIADGLIELIKLTNGIIELIKNNYQAQAFDTETLLTEITTRIESGNKILYDKIKFVNKLSDIEDVENKINSALVELKYLIRASATERKQYQDLFIEKGITAVEFARNLPGLITRSVPGTTNDFLQQFSSNCRCNMTLIDEFQFYYRNLAGNGMMIEILYKYLKNIRDLENEEKFWKDAFGIIDLAFTEQKYGCKRKFTEQFQEDIDNAASTSALQTNNQQRYNWLFNDVLFTKKGVPGKFLNILNCARIRCFYVTRQS